MSALDVVKRWTSGVALRINALIFPGATPGHVLTVVNDGHGGTEVIPQAAGGGGGGLSPGLTVGSMIRWNGSAWVDIPHGREEAQLLMKSGNPQWHDESPYGFSLRYEGAAVNGVDTYDVPLANPSPSTLVTTLAGTVVGGGGTALVAAGGAEPTYLSGMTLRFGTSKEMSGAPSGAEFPVGTADCTVVLIGSNWNTGPNQLFLRMGNAAGGGTAPCTAWGLGTLGDSKFGWRGGASDEESFAEDTSADMRMLIAYVRGGNKVALSFNGAPFSGEQTHSYNIGTSNLVVGHGFDLAAVFVFDHVIDDGERSQLQRYASHLGVDIGGGGDVGGEESGGGPSALYGEIALPIIRTDLATMGGDPWVDLGVIAYDAAAWQVGTGLALTHLFAFTYRASAGTTLDIQLYDATNAAAIHTESGLGGAGLGSWAGYATPVTIPDSCAFLWLRARLLGGGGGDVLQVLGAKVAVTLTFPS